MDSIRIKNVGPIKDTGFMLLKRITVIMSDEFDSRDLLLRIICFMRWFEERVCMDSSDVVGARVSGEELKATLCARFGVSENVFCDDSEIHYEGEFIHMSWVQGGNVNTYVKTWKEGYATDVAFLSNCRFVMYPEKEDSGLVEVPFQYGLACEMLKDFYMKKYTKMLPLGKSFYKNSDEFFFMDSGVKDGSETRQITRDELSPIIPGFILYIALHCLQNVGRVKRVIPFDISKCKSIIDELSNDNSPRDEITKAGCSHLCICEVDAFMSSPDQIWHTMRVLTGIMMNGCYKYRIGEMESSIVMTTDDFDVYTSLIELVSKRKWRQRYMVCYKLTFDGILDGPMELY